VETSSSARRSTSSSWGQHAKLAKDFALLDERRGVEAVGVQGRCGRGGAAQPLLEDGQRLVVGDLRYDFEPELGFAEVETLRTMPPDARGCEHLPPWRSVVVERLLAE
jgi:hypothetical protein